MKSNRGMIVALAFMFCGALGIMCLLLCNAIAYGNVGIDMDGIMPIWAITFTCLLYGGILGALVSLVKDIPPSDKE